MQYLMTEWRYYVCVQIKLLKTYFYAETSHYFHFHFYFETLPRFYFIGLLNSFEMASVILFALFPF